ncbi:MAG TPA: ABC transporter permease [Terriglobales bacterium]|nr:ABC transporter permease [Terriglobales bacterium]
MRLPGFIALRYLRPRRGRGVLSVVTAIAITGFAAGVGALILALAVTNGFRDALQNELVGATSQLNLLKRAPTPISDYPALMERLRHLPHVVAVAPEIYQVGLLIRGSKSHEVVLKGIVPREELQIGHMLQKLYGGSLAPLEQQPQAPNLILGKDLAETLGAEVGSSVDLYLPNAELTPLGMGGKRVSFRVVGIFQTGYLDFDSGWAYTSLRAAQALAPQNQGDWASDIEFHLDNIYAADEVAREAEAVAGPEFTTTTWITQNRPIFQALQLERLGTLVVISLVVLVAALNVLIMLTMLVMEKRKEIAVLLSLGARRRQIRRIFVYQGLWIAGLGTGLGLGLAYPLAWAANRYHWIPVSAQVYAVDYIPFHANAWDGVLVAVLALAIAFVATLYPSQRALAVLPAETLRYE